MTTAEALAVVREAMEGEWFSEEVDAALALIEQRVAELEAALREIRNGWSGSDPMELVRIARRALGGGE